ncbi:MAG: transposase [Deltaproteobacteria bacterium]|nr:transposase [Deltaproteobacteria bacterium]
MSRSPRVDFPGAVHHVYARGIEKRKIFFDDWDRTVFLQRVLSNVPRWKVRCIAWALMENHFHFLVISDGGNLPFFMRCLLTGYSLYFNDRHMRAGHLFQNRYKSRHIIKESHLLAAIRYIHLNPVRSGLVHSIEDLAKYPWTGHEELLSDSAGWMDFETLESLFSDGGRENWKIEYRKFVEFGYTIYSAGNGCIEREKRNLFGEVDNATTRFNDDGKPPEVFCEILRHVSAQTGVPAEIIMDGGRRYCEVNARRELLNMCKKELNFPVVKLARWLGISESSASYLLKTKKSERRSF